MTWTLGSCVSLLHNQTATDSNEPGQQQTDKLHSTGRRLRDDIPPPVVALGFTRMQAHIHKRVHAQLRNCLSWWRFPEPISLPLSHTDE